MYLRMTKCFFEDDLHLEPCCQYAFYRMKQFLPGDKVTLDHILCLVSHQTGLENLKTKLESVATTLCRRRMLRRWTILAKAASTELESSSGSSSRSRTSRSWARWWSAWGRWHAGACWPGHSWCQRGTVLTALDIKNKTRLPCTFCAFCAHARRALMYRTVDVQPPEAAAQLSQLHS